MPENLLVARPVVRIPHLSHTTKKKALRFNNTFFRVQDGQHTIGTFPPHYTLYTICYTLQYKLPGARYTPYLGTLYTFTLPGYARRVHYEYTLVIRVCT